MIDVRGLGARRGQFELREVSFAVERGQYGVVIGPAGSGKTTLLETIAGVTRQRTGRLFLDGRDATEVPMEDRGIGLVYQHGFLFPHLDVRANVAYGAQGAGEVAALLETFELAPFAARPVQSLSGGERQVVALARALARRAPILLLDEPFSALDPRRRAGVRRLVRELARSRGTTVLQVTHDFAEAGVLGDHLVLLDQGRVLQHGSPADVFSRPVSGYVAEFLGAENVLSGTARSGADEDARTELNGARSIEFTSGPLAIAGIGDVSDGPCCAVIRAEEVVLSRVPAESSMRNYFRGQVAAVGGHGAQARVTVDVAGVPIVAALTWRSVDELALREGETVFVSFKAMAVHFC